MKVTIIHPRHKVFPVTGIDWAEKRVYPIGVIGDIGSDIVFGIVQQERQRWAVSVSPDGTVEELDAHDAGEALFEALDKVGSQLWGYSWNSAIGEIYGINRRTTQRDRVTTNLLPPRIVMNVAYIASAPDAFELAGLLLAISKYTNALEYDMVKTEASVKSAIDYYFGARSDATLGLSF